MSSSQHLVRADDGLCIHRIVKFHKINPLIGHHFSPTPSLSLSLFLFSFGMTTIHLNNFTTFLLSYSFKASVICKYLNSKKNWYIDFNKKRQRRHLIYHLQLFGEWKQQQQKVETSRLKSLKTSFNHDWTMMAERWWRPVFDCITIINIIINVAAR